MLVTIVITVVAGVPSAGVCVALGAGALKHSVLESSPLPSEDRGGEGGEGGGAASAPSPPPPRQVPCSRLDCLAPSFLPQPTPIGAAIIPAACKTEGPADPAEAQEPGCRTPRRSESRRSTLGGVCEPWGIVCACGCQLPR